jgi:hypothetical protein
MSVFLISEEARFRGLPIQRNRLRLGACYRFPAGPVPA